MEYRGNRVTLWGWAILFLLMVISFKILPGWIPFFRREWVPMLAAFIILVPKLFKEYGSLVGLLVPLSFYAIVAFLNCMMGDSSYKTYPIVIYSILLLFVPMFLSINVMKDGNVNFMKMLLLSSFIFFSVELIASSVILRNSPGLIRSLYGESLTEGGMDFQFAYYKMGLLDYTMAHALPILIPPLLYSYKTSESKIRVISLILIVIVIALTFISDSTTSLFLTVVMLLLGIVTDTGGLQGNKSKIFGLLLLLLPLLFVDDLKVLILDFIGSILGDTSTHISKIEELKHSVLYNESTGDLASRGEKYITSLMAFIKNPIFGTNEDLGNHAALIDQLATLGLVGFIPLVSLFIKYVRIIKSYFSESGRTFYYEGILSFLLMLLLKGMWCWPMFFCMCILLPFSIYWIDQNKKVNENENNI